jgi:hypothetical protein
MGVQQFARRYFLRLEIGNHPACRCVKVGHLC